MIIEGFNRTRVRLATYMSADVLLNLLNKLGKRDKMGGFFATSLINSIIQEAVRSTESDVRFYLSYDPKTMF